MKKLFAVILIVALLFSLTSCFSSTPATQTEGTVNNTMNETEQPENAESKPQEETVSYEITDNRVKTWTNSIGTTWIQEIIEITNTGNTNLFLSSGKIEIDDENGNLISVDDLVSVYPQIIAPGERAYYYNETTLDASADIQLTLKPTIKAEKAKVPLIKYETSDFAISDDEYLGIKALGRITNTTDEDESLPSIAVFLYNSDNSLLGLIASTGSTIAAGETTAEEITGFTLPDDITTSVVDHIEVIAYPYQFQF